MAATPSTRNPADESWPITTASVISCQHRYTKLRDIDLEDPTDQSSVLVTFKYTVNGELYVDDFEAGTDYEEGHQFEIGYNPTNPQLNTYSTPLQSRRSKFTTWIVGGILGGLLIYLSNKFGWND